MQIEDREAIVSAQVDLIKICYADIKDAYEEVISMNKDIVGEDSDKLVNQIADALRDFTQMHIPIFNNAITHINDLCLIAVKKNLGKLDNVSIL